MAKISVCILTRDDADNVAGAVENVRWADEIVVVDNASSDRTVAIAKSLGVRVEQIATEKFGEMRTLAANAATHEWIFILDADERCPPALRDEILGLIRGLHERLNTTVIVVTHDMKVAESCSRTIALRDGRIVEDIRR